MNLGSWVLRSIAGRAIKVEMEVFVKAERKINLNQLVFACIILLGFGGMGFT